MYTSSYHPSSYRPSTTTGFKYILTCNSYTLNVTRFVSKQGNFINNIRAEYHLRIHSIKLRHIKHKIYENMHVVKNVLKKEHLTNKSLFNREFP